MLHPVPAPCRDGRSHQDAALIGYFKRPSQCKDQPIFRVLFAMICAAPWT